jgi:hypothetical protein
MWDFVSRVVFGVASGALALLAGALFVYAGTQVFHSSAEQDIGSKLLDAIGYTIVAVAVFEVAKYFFDEHVFDPTDMRSAREARQGLTKFLTTIIIALFLEALVSVFVASREDPSMMLLPILLLFAGVATIIALGVYQRLSASVEATIPEESKDG